MYTNTQEGMHTVTEKYHILDQLYYASSRLTLRVYFSQTSFYLYIFVDYIDLLCSYILFKSIIQYLFDHIF